MQCCCSTKCLFIVHYVILYIYFANVARHRLAVEVRSYRTRSTAAGSSYFTEVHYKNYCCCEILGKLVSVSQDLQALQNASCQTANSWLNIRDFASSINVKQGDHENFFEIHFDLDLALNFKIWFGSRSGNRLPLCGLRQRWPESLIQVPIPFLFQNFWIRIQVRKFFKFENPTLVQTPATIDANEILVCFYLRNDNADSSTAGIETCLCNRVNKLMWGVIIQKAKIICCNWEFYFNIGFRNKNKPFRFNQKLNKRWFGV